ncbi:MULTISPECIES: cation acetate symporter [unclassified Micromonospora]|uniref:sodium/solute symporter n=1 Tax=unclassified Micromonospora TaxID=2617518 RepID=UPI0003EEC8C0|nr:MULTISPECIES: cation acetate symporter [unclassified Micromonospora]EWM66901.1 sodium:solute symporter [Micromonospora sp. M42]MCK1804849.1 cation acetate symporter [Micromonospora sp. R42106]MCK1831132.1 cation acetate symporter [Micromonospora sp. R42003]MCK1842237.1 cation acetate symporter [Micromonospora sp. R42004]MCM1018237.1 cation acetate symporter [Micromonospora sp. XM-20-01]
MSNGYVVPAIVAVTLVTVGIGFYGLRLARTTSDFLVASRAISPTWNAAAIGGEYLSAASFLGVAGLILKYGVDVLWYPVGFAAGYLALLLFVAAPLRRSGAFTLPDFCEVRLGSRRLRTLATVFVIFIGWLYLVPQLQGAGLTLATLTGSPYPLGALLVAVVVTANVALGGMRAITFVQAFQYWLKLTALAVPAIFLALQWQADARPAVTPPDGPTFRTATTVVVEHRATLTLPDGDIREVRPGDRLEFAAGDPVPEVSGAATGPTEWLLPDTAGENDRGLFATYSLILATFLGTMGLPHVLVRFYTNPDGAAARRTTLVVLALVGVFYLLPTVYGVLGRIYTPQLLVSGQTDAVVVLLPGAALGDGTTGRLLAALVAAGAFAAFLSTSSGLLTSVAGVISTDVLGRGSVRGFRLATVIAGGVPALLSLNVSGLDVSQVVGLAFAVAASSFCPLLVLGIWWRGLTDLGAAAGVLVGGGAAVGAVLLTVLGPPLTGWPATLTTQPAAWTVPLAFTVMVLVSMASRRRLPRDVGATMLRLHTPESLRL